MTGRLHTTTEDNEVTVVPGAVTAYRAPAGALPALGSVIVDADRDVVGIFCGTSGDLWSLRPVTGGTEWTVDPADARPATPEQRLRAETAGANARSRGEYL
ncbi:hypothetical protein ACFVT5_11110 [Streptomyces sp. NPDC058001]|uniref:hypothetical protein n=1 Tax=Streptomyces sp. NPDC058001 TaxID=3346300 RepID=UPI0036F1747A